MSFSTELTPELGDQLQLGPAQLDVGGEEVELHRVGAQAHLGDVDAVVGEHVVHRQLEVVGTAAAHVDGEMSLRVEVDSKDARTFLSERGGQVHRGRRLADAALLVRDRDDPCHVDLERTGAPH